MSERIFLRVCDPSTRAFFRLSDNRKELPELVEQLFPKLRPAVDQFDEPSAAGGEASTSFMVIGVSLWLFT